MLMAECRHIVLSVMRVTVGKILGSKGEVYL